MIDMKKHIVSAVCAVSMVLSAVLNPFFSVSLAADNIESTSSTAIINDGELTQQSFEVYPNEEDQERNITLAGEMPEGVVPEAVDVSDEHNGILAYDISIYDGDDEYQPDDEHPVFVEINDPSITENIGIELWHISDDGERERITDITVQNGRLSFYALSFSVYEIVGVDAGQAEWTQIKTVSELANYDINSNGFRIISIASNGGFFYFDDTIISDKDNRVGITKTTNVVEAAEYYIEKVSGSSDQFYLFCEPNSKKYIKCYVNSAGKGCLTLVNDETERTVFTASTNTDGKFQFCTKIGNANWYINMQGGDNGKRYCAFNTKGDPNNDLVLYTKKYEDDPCDLHGKSYGLFHYTENATSGNAFMSAGDSHSLVKLVLKADGNNRVLYVDQDNEIDRWNFEYESDGKYLIYTENANGRMYLCADSDGISTVVNSESADRFNIESDDSNRIRIKSNGVYLTYEADNENFGITTDGSKTETWMWLLDRAELEEKDLITFSADRVSVSDIKDGDKVIVYIRIWNEEDLRYDMYAVDYNGTLYPCYASGGKIMWLGDGTCSMEWKFKEYLDPVTKQPNYYYELYNPYSEKYIAPQFTTQQVLSEEPIGINMQGRRKGDFYSEIIAWDDARVKYIGMRPNEDKTALEPCSQAVSYPFYFATLEELNLSDKLHEVPTIDNNEFGIKMKMVNYDAISGQNYGGSQASTLTRDYFGGKASTDDLVTGMLSTNLKENGYPDISGPSGNQSIGKDLAGAFSSEIGARTVNHLFLEKVYHSSGYFEFDSCQNFATLKKTDDNGNIVFNENTNNNETDFKVYRELGTHDHSKSESLKHGQFFPYDTIKPGVYSAEGNNPVNLYSNMRKELSKEDPRKYEQLHKIQNEDKKQADFYFGMEMEASFVQTPSGLDAWGHDIVFEFAGDDDFWLYVDDELVLDLGGTHSALMGKVNFRTGVVTFDYEKTHSDNMKTKTLREIFADNYKKRNPNASVAEIDSYLSEFFEDGETVFSDYSTHKMKIFYLERGGNASNLYMRFNLAAVTPGHVVMSKGIKGDGAEDLDTDFMEYPFQIYYTLPDGVDGGPGEERLLGNNNDYFGVSYQNSNQPVTFVEKYRPPGFTEEQAYRNVYFINPSKNAEISFPDNTINYRIVECAVDSTVYSSVKINGEEVPSDRVEVKGNLKSYSSETGAADKKPSISFDNYVQDNVIKDLYFTKKLLDEDNHEITDDPTTFSFRLYMSSVEVPVEDIPLANMYRYYVLKDRRICIYDYENEKYVVTDLVYNHDVIKAVDEGMIEGYEHDDITFSTSGFGAIANIPAGYTVCVPGLPVGSVFKVTEDVKTGYGLVGYDRENGEKVENGISIPIASYNEYDNNPLNVGIVNAEENPQMNIMNKKGYGLDVNKKWSDLDTTVSHSPVYVAVYVDGELLEGSVKQIPSTSTTVYYFWTSLKPNPDGSQRTDFEGYEVREVILSGEPVVANDGTVTGYSSIKQLGSGEKTKVTATRTLKATPDGESRDKEYDYVVNYRKGIVEGSSRTDTIINNREGGISVRLFKWDSDVPLSGGSFELSVNGMVVGEYSADSSGTIAMLHSFEREKMYALTQKSAPKGFVGLQKKLCFRIMDDDTIELYEGDGTTTWSENDAKWAKWSTGENGITAFVDVYNKPFNFKIVKTDSEDSGLKLGAAHFALYKQVPTTISGYVKNKDPMTGFEDMATKNGEVIVCGGSSGRYIDPGANGSVYFLTEIQAPFNYKKLEEDIIFRISAIGVPSLISDSYHGQLVQTEDSYIYTLSVPNVKEDETLEFLTIEKTVVGAYGNRNKEFTFTVTVDNSQNSDGYQWAKNGEEQTLMPKEGCKFTMKHNDKVQIALPKNVNVTVSEKNEHYKSTFKRDDEEAKQTDNVSFVFVGESKLVVINRLDGDVATGIFGSMGRSLQLVIIPAFTIGIMVGLKRRKRHFKQPLA